VTSDLRGTAIRFAKRFYDYWSNYYVNRTIQALATLYAVITISFVLIRMLPGSPAEKLKAQMINSARQSGGSVDMQQINTRVEAYLNVNPGGSIWEQYVDYMSSMFMGDFGYSIWYNEPVMDLIANALPWTMLLSSGATLIGLTTGIVLGILMAYYEGSKFDVGMTLYTIFMSSIPFYVLGILFVYVFVYQFGVFPDGGQYAIGTTPGLNWPFIKGVLEFVALPLSAFVLTGFGGGLGMRANCIRILGSDYLRVARLRGLSSYRIALRYVGRNAVLPLYTGFMISLGTFFGGSIIIEQIFKYPGMGNLTFGAIQHSDYALMMGGFIMITTAVIVGILLADFTYGWVDPRAKTSNRQSYSGGGGGLITKLRRRLSQSSSSTSTTDGPVPSAAPMGAADGATTANMEALDLSTAEASSEPLLKRLYRTFDKLIYAPFMVVWSDYRGKAAVVILFIYTLAATVGAWVTPPVRTNAVPRLKGAFHGGIDALWTDGGWIDFVGTAPFVQLHYPLGSDQLGQDLFALMVEATPPMFKMILAGAVFATVMSAGIGILSGFKGGLTDRALMTAADIVMTIPGLPLTIILAAIFNPRSPYLIGLLLTVNNWGGTARQIRSQVLSVRESEYIEASRAMGLSTSTILLRDILPNLAPYALIKFVGKARSVIFGSVALYYLDMLPFSTLNWGVALNQSYQSGTALLTWDAAHWFAVPMMTIIMFSFGLYLFSQAADQLTNPRVRARHARTVDEEEVEAGGSQSATGATSS
jgi:ABC-type dipeptide/oligopeptide/nickel transport system permease component